MSRRSARRGRGNLGSLQGTAPLAEPRSSESARNAAASSRLAAPQVDPVAPRAEALRVGIFGGSFDPVHAGHLHVARAAARARALQRIVFVPARRPPHKPERILAEGEDRAEMLRLALAEHPDWRVAEVELARAGPSYTIDTVLELRRDWGPRLAAEARAPGVRWFLLLGGDNLDGLPEWKRAGELLQQVEPIVVARGRREREALEGLRGRLAGELLKRLEAGLLDLPEVRISATALRQRLARGEDPGDELPPGVLEYIRRRGIYGFPRGRTPPPA